MILGNGPKAPVGCFLSLRLLRFDTQYAEYERSVELNNSLHSISRPVLSVAQRKSIWSCLLHAYFDETELVEDDDLRKALVNESSMRPGCAHINHASSPFLYGLRLYSSRHTIPTVFPVARGNSPPG